MTSSSRLASPLGLTQAQQRAISRAAGKLRIVAHNGADLVGGAERALIELLRGLQQRGHTVTLCCNHDLVADAAVRRLVPAMVLPLRGDLVLGDAFRFAKFLRRDQPDALLLGTFKKIWLGGLAGRRAGVERIVARIGLASDTPRRLKYKIALRRFIDRVVLNADAMRAAFRAGVPDFDPARIITIYNGVIPPLVARERGALRRELSIPPGASVIGAVARLARQKRLDRLIEVTHRLHDVHCVIAGAGSERATLEKLVRERGLHDRVHLLGHRDDVGDVLSALDLFVVTSDQEGMANAMLEALWCGVPVLSTPVSGAAEALEPLPGGQRPGAVAADFQVETLASEVRRLLQDRADLRRMSVAAEARALERFDYDRMISEWARALGTDGIPPQRLSA